MKMVQCEGPTIDGAVATCRQRRIMQLEASLFKFEDVDLSKKSSHHRSEGHISTEKG